MRDAAQAARENMTLPDRLRQKLREARNVDTLNVTQSVLN
jgi:hypothetical protein